MRKLRFKDLLSSLNEGVGGRTRVCPTLPQCHFKGYHHLSKYSILSLLLFIYTFQRQAFNILKSEFKVFLYGKVNSLGML